MDVENNEYEEFGKGVGKNVRRSYFIKIYYLSAFLIWECIYQNPSRQRRRRWKKNQK